MAKQVLVVRKDLNMDINLLGVRVSHASTGIILNMMKNGLSKENFISNKIGDEYILSVDVLEDSPLDDWLRGIFKKITVEVNSEEEINRICNKAEKKGLPVYKVFDEDTTELVVVAIGPDTEKAINRVTGSLKLYTGSESSTYKEIQPNKSMSKQVLVVRKDLNMDNGKFGAQVAHGSLGSFLKVVREGIDVQDFKPVINNGKYTLTLPVKVGSFLDEWIKGDCFKQILEVETEEELLNLYEKAKEMNLISVKIIDAGLTVFNKPTLTVLGIGPHFNEKIDKVVGHLNEYKK